MLDTCLELGRDIKRHIVLGVLVLWFLVRRNSPRAPDWDRLLSVIQGSDIRNIGTSIDRIHDSNCKSFTDIASEKLRIPAKILEAREVVVRTFDVMFWENRRAIIAGAQLLELLDIVNNHPEKPHKELVECG